MSSPLIGTRTARLGRLPSPTLCFLATVVTACGVGGPASTQSLPPDLARCRVEAVGSRTVSTHVPRGHPLPLPLVLVIHGLGGHGSDMESTTNFDDVADRDGAIVVYPDAANGQWNQAPAVLGSDPDDVTFLTAIVDRLTANGCVSPERVYVTGISNGGGMAYRMACDARVPVAAIGTVSADYLGGDKCSRSNAVPAIALHGTSDSRVPLGGVTYGTSVHPPVEQWASDWAVRNGCRAANPAVSTDPTLSARVLQWQECPPAGAVVLYEIDGGGHEWFGGATSKVWAFFRQHSLPRA